MRRRNRWCITPIGEARIAMLSPAAWRARYAPTARRRSRSLERRFEHFQARQRQFAAVLGAHGVPVTFAHCAQGDRRRAVRAQREHT